MTNTTNLQVLIVENEPMDSQVLASLVKSLGIAYSIANDGADVLDQLDELNNIDIIFLDLEMPKVDGFELLQAIQDDGRFTHIPVVAYSSHANAMNDAHQAGFNGFLTKPVDGNQFANYLDSILKGEGVWE